jgi:hypothetical protein
MVLGNRVLHYLLGKFQFLQVNRYVVTVVTLIYSVYLLGINVDCSLNVANNNINRIFVRLYSIMCSL